MQWKLASLSALLALASAAQAFVITTPTGPVKTGQNIVLFYSANATDPLAAFLLVNRALPNKTYVAVEDVPTWSGTIAAIPPCVNTHLKGWYFAAVNNSDFKQVLATTGHIDLVKGDNC